MTRDAAIPGPDDTPAPDGSRSHVDLGAGPVEILDTGGTGPTIVLLHGLLMDETLWSGVLPPLVAAGHRCVVPTLPLGAHREAMPSADLTWTGVAALVTELLERLDLRDVTLVGNDTGGALVQFVVATRPERVARIALVSCDAFDNFPPGATGTTLVLTGKLAPSLFGAFMQQLRLRPFRRLPISFGWLTKRGDATVKGWLLPLWSTRGIRHDAVRLLRALNKDKRALAGATAQLGTFDGPALVVWATEDRVMPPEHGRRLAELLPRSELVQIDDSYTLIPLDQPEQLAMTLATFVTATATATAPRSRPGADRSQP